MVIPGFGQTVSVHEVGLGVIVLLLGICKLNEPVPSRGNGPAECWIVPPGQVTTGGPTKSHLKVPENHDWPAVSVTVPLTVV